MTLKNMPPRFSALDATHLGTANTKVSGYHAMHSRVGSDRYHLRLREFRNGLPANAGWGLSALFVSVRDVFCLGAQEQMARIYALWNIASVTDAQAIWNKSVGQSPCDSVSQAHSTIRPELTVAGSDCGCRPQPALARLVHLAPKSVLYTLSSHVTSLGSVVRGAVGTSGPSALRYFSTVMS